MPDLDQMEKSVNNFKIRDSSVTTNLSNLKPFKINSAHTRASTSFHTQKHNSISVMPFHPEQRESQISENTIVLSKNQIAFTEQVRREREYTAAKESDYIQTMKGKAHSPRAESRPNLHP